MLLDKFSIEEHNEIIAITESLLKFFSDKKEGLVLRPTFLGCGFVDASEGDIIAQKTIFEIKTVDRKLRSKDIRQLITYAALNNASNKFPIDRVGLVNPRKGLYFSLSVDEVCSRISGASAAALLPVIIDALSSGSISR